MPRRASRWIGRWGALLLLALGASVGDVGAQVLADSVTIRRGEYTIQRGRLESANEALTVRQGEMGRALDAVTRARATGDASLLSSANREAQVVALRLSDQERRVAEVESDLGAARSALLAALDAARVRLENQLLAAPDAEREREILRLSADLENQYQEIENDGQQPEPVPDYFPRTRLQPRDTPASIELKAGILATKARSLERNITDAEAEVERLENRSRFQQMARDARNNRDRFGDAQPPLGDATQRVNVDPAILADTTGAALGRLPIDQQLTIYREYLAQLQRVLSLVRAQEQRFRERLVGRNGAGVER